MCKDFNDYLALILMFVIPLLWVFQGLTWITLEGEIIGATIMGWTLVLQFYYRKRKDES
ncbi:MAG TPA: hypothetical protein VIH69_05605 [Dehalococcoidia bacterium]